ncbi:hypothetical protein Ndes2526B_g00360 [Nannochloris sp. 'desiccata']|nr:putative Poly(A) polymerase I [Chlorella desiccata (nom. nud.)]
MLLRRAVMSGLAFLIQPFAAATAPSPAFFSSSILGNSLSLLRAESVASLRTLAARRFTCNAQYGSRQFSSSDPLLAGAPVAAATVAGGGGNRDTPSSSSSPPPKKPRKAAPRRRKAKFANNDYVEAAAAAADLLDLDLIKNNDNNIGGEKEQHKFVFETTQPNEALDLLPPALVLEDDAHPIREHLISGAAWTVLLRLRSSGHQAYIVGGTVRDMLLNKIPKDYDILTSAEPPEIEYLFPRAFVLGRSFPICHVHHDNEIIEVSSFSTNADPSRIPLDVAAMMTMSGRESGRRSRSSNSSRLSRGGRKGQLSKRVVGSDNDGNNDGGGGWRSALEELIDDEDATGALTSSLMKNEGPTWATARRDNATKRDFRVNGLLYDPFSRILYDYVGGIADCTAKILRTMGSPTHSFTQDPARILRAVRLAARVGLEIEEECSNAMTSMAMTTAKLPQGRLQMELAAMFTHGAALPALQLLWRYGLLDMLLPHHAVMLSKQHIPREEKIENINEADCGKENIDNDIVSISSNAPASSQVLFALLAELDKTASACKPAETAVWVTAIVAPLVAQECQRAVERRAAAQLRKQRQTDAEDEEERSSSSSSNEWYDVDDIDALLPSKKINISNNGVAARAKRKLKNSDGAGKAGGKEEEEEAGAVDGVPCGPEYLEIYGKIVDKVMAKVLSKPIAKTQKQLAKIAPCAVLLGSGGGVKKKKSTKNNDSTPSVTSAHGISNGTSASTNTASNSSSTASPAVPVLSCVLPRQAVEAARSYLKLEALLRGQELPELNASSYDKERGGAAAGGKKRSGAQQPRHIGRSKKGRGRKLAANEYLVLQLLRAPSVQWAQATQLAMDGEEE